MSASAERGLSEVVAAIETLLKGELNRIINDRAQRGKRTPARVVYLCGMTDVEKPRMEPYSRHVLVCTGGFCSPERRGRELYALLPELLQRERLRFGPRRVKR